MICLIEKAANPISSGISRERKPAQSLATLASGVGAGAAALGDFNGDGIPDLVITAQDRNRIAVYIFNDDDTSQPAVFYDVGDTPSAIAAADLNGDGILDLVVTNQFSNNISVLLGHGDGTFQPARNFAMGMYPNSLAIGDFNGDGKPDVAVAASDALYLMPGAGDGSFQAPVSLIAPGGSSVISADFNSDGRLDLALGQVDPNTVSETLVILPGNGDGTFQKPIPSDPGSGYPDFLAVGDFNQDGKLDIAVSHALSNSVSVKLGAGDGTFQPAVSYAAGTLSYSFSVLDIDGDGALDFVFTDDSSSELFQVLLGNGDGTFRAPPYYPVPSLGRGNQQLVNSIAVADFDGDGKLDVVAAAGYMALFRGQGAGKFSPAANIGPGASFVVAGDFNSDGKQDLAASTGVMIGKGDGTFQALAPYPSGVKGQYIVAADFNGDGKKDLALANSGGAGAAPGNVSVLLGKGDGTFQAPLTYSAGSHPVAIALGDFNRDGKMDLAVADNGGATLMTTDPGGVSILLGAGDGTFTPGATLSLGATLGAGSYPLHLAAADLNGDGNLDLVIATQGFEDSGAVAVLLGNGDGTFQAPVLMQAPNPVQWVSIFDVDGDGKLDIVDAEGNSDLGFFAGAGDGTFQAQSLFPGGPDPVQLVVADFNGDGNPDLVVADNSGGLGPGGGMTVLINNPQTGPAQNNAGGSAAAVKRLFTPPAHLGH